MTLITLILAVFIVILLLVVFLKRRRIARMTDPRRDHLRRRK